MAARSTEASSGSHGPARGHAHTWSILLVGGWRPASVADCSLQPVPNLGGEAFVAVDFPARLRRDVEPLTYGQIVPLVFMWAELRSDAGVVWVGFTLLPFAAGLASLPLFWRFAQSVLPRRPALLAIGIFAASVYLVRHAAEVKPYATDMLLALGLLMLAWRVCENRGGAGSWAALIVGGAAAVWCSYPVIFVLSAIRTLLAWR